jgi:hypothetical protein
VKGRARGVAGDTHTWVCCRKRKEKPGVKPACCFPRRHRRDVLKDHMGARECSPVWPRAETAETTVNATVMEKLSSVVLEAPPPRRGPPPPPPPRLSAARRERPQGLTVCRSRHSQQRATTARTAN